MTKAETGGKELAEQPTLLKRSAIIGSAPKLETCLQRVAQSAGTDTPVLITGETGTGKELFARAVHDNSRRSSGPFVVLDCAAFPENLVESMLFGHCKSAFTGADHDRDGLILQADKGTLFMDEEGVSPEFFQALKAYAWPGNVRELVNAIDCAIAAAQEHEVLYPVHRLLMFHGSESSTDISPSKPD